jgi:hypothetical protein
MDHHGHHGRRVRRSAHGRLAPLEVHAPWVRLLGLAILLAATALTLWARLALGVMWTAAPTVKQEHQLRTSGPYAGPGWKLGEWRDGAPCWPLAGCESH